MHLLRAVKHTNTGSERLISVCVNVKSRPCVKRAQTKAESSCESTARAPLAQETSHQNWASAEHRETHSVKAHTHTCMMSSDRTRTRAFWVFEESEGSVV